MNKNEKFEQFIFENFGQSKRYDKMRHNLLRVLDIMLDRHPEFKKMSAAMQYSQCFTICMIAVETSLKDLYSARVLGNKKEVFRFSIDEGFVPPVPIFIGDRKNIAL